MAVSGHKSRAAGASAKADIEAKRRLLQERTRNEVGRIVAKYHKRFPRNKAESIGCVYARYSTRHQDSIADQVHKILEDAVKLQVYVPREFGFYDLAVRGFKKHRKGLDAAQQVLKTKKAGTLLLFATSRLFRKVYRQRPRRTLSCQV